MLILSFACLPSFHSSFLPSILPINPVQSELGPNIAIQIETALLTSKLHGDTLTFVLTESWDMADYCFHHGIFTSLWHLSVISGFLEVDSQADPFSSISPELIIYPLNM